jgi:uncharacterized membrane protein
MTNQTQPPPSSTFGSVTADSIVVDAPPEVVWAVYTDVDRWPEWTASVTTARVDPPGPLAIGSRATIKQPRFPRVTWTVTELEPETVWIWANRSPGAATSAGHRLTALDDGRTRIDLWVDQRGVLGRPIGWLARRTTRRYLRMEAEGLRNRSEAGYGSPPP